VKMAEDNAVLIRKKPIMKYVLACISLFHAGENEVFVKARCRAISRAVDFVEVTRRSFMPDLKIQKIGIGQTSWLHSKRVEHYRTLVTSK
jgi:archaea-specific DNA-binding protein